VTRTRRRSRSVNGRCVAATPHNRRHAGCTRLTSTRGGFTRCRRAGSDRFTFTGRMAGTALKPGRDSLQATHPRAGGPASPPRSAFRIVS
jgi:hypothetical protein